MLASLTPYENLQPPQYCISFKKCCFCIPLRTGCFILGYTSLVINFIITIFYTTSFAIMVTFYSYVNAKQAPSGEAIRFNDTAIDRTKLHVTLVVMLLVGLLNVSWLFVNAFLLIGIHKKRPGPIRVHVTVATIRLLLSVLGLINMNPNKTGFCWIEIGLSGYFIIMYYAYAIQLERVYNSEERKCSPDEITDMVFSCSKTYDKSELTRKDKIEVVDA